MRFQLYPIRTAHFCAFVMVFLITIPSIIRANSKKLEKVSDDEFLKLVQSEKYVVALFSKYEVMKYKVFYEPIGQNKMLIVIIYMFKN